MAGYEIPAHQIALHFYRRRARCSGARVVCGALGLRLLRAGMVRPTPAEVCAFSIAALVAVLLTVILLFL